MIFSYHVIIWFVKTVGHALQIVSLERLSVFVLQDSTESTVLSAVSFSKDIFYLGKKSIFPEKSILK